MLHYTVNSTLHTKLSEVNNYKQAYYQRNNIYIKKLPRTNLSAFLYSK